MAFILALIQQFLSSSTEAEQNLIRSVIADLEEETGDFSKAMPFGYTPEQVITYIREADGIHFAHFAQIIKRMQKLAEQEARLAEIYEQLLEAEERYEKYCKEFFEESKFKDSYSRQGLAWLKQMEVHALAEWRELDIRYWWAANDVQQTCEED